MWLLAKFSSLQWNDQVPAFLPGDGQRLFSAPRGHTCSLPCQEATHLSPWVHPGRAPRDTRLTSPRPAGHPSPIWNLFLGKILAILKAQGISLLIISKATHQGASLHLQSSSPLYPHHWQEGHQICSLASNHGEGITLRCVYTG